MVKKMSVVLALLFVAAAPLQADLKVVSKLEVRKVETTEAPNPFFAMMGNAMAQQMTQMNGMETTTFIGEGRVRTEMSKPLPNLPPFTITIMRADGTMIGINPTDKTYYESKMPDMSALLEQGMKPTVTVNRTGESATLLGRRVEQVMVEMKMPLPIPPEAAAQLPPGFPSEIVMTIENWTAEALKQYGTEMVKGNPTMAALGLGDVADIGFAMRQILRSPMLAGYEMETTVTSVSEESLPASLFDVPDGYTQVAAPTGMPGMGGGSLDRN
jgi:hypothetical protein